MELAEVFKQTSHRRVLSIIMPGGTNFHGKRVECLEDCPGWTACRYNGPDHRVCSNKWMCADAHPLNESIVTHVLNRFDYYNQSDQNLTMDSVVVGKMREVLRFRADGGKKSNSSAMEGGMQLRVHMSRERGALAEKKKRQVKRTTGRLECEVCDFVFERFYGSRGADFAECHHKRPLASYISPRKTTLNDLAIVCSNCHSMLHREPVCSMSELRAKIRARHRANAAE